MKLLRPLSLSFLISATMLSPVWAKSESADQSSAKVAVKTTSAYAGIAPLPLTENARREVLQTEIAPGVGVLVGFIDPQGPAVNQLEVNDVITHFDDQVLVNVDQFRTLVRMHQPNDVVKLKVVRGNEVKSVDFKLGVKTSAINQTAPPQLPAQSSKASPVKPSEDEPISPGVRITINGQTFDLGAAPLWSHPGMPPEIARQFEEMSRRGEELRRRSMMAPPPDLQNQEKPAEGSIVPTPQTQSKSFSFQWGAGDGASLTSSSVATDQQGSVSLKQSKGKKYAIIQDAAGKVLFAGDVTTEESRAQLSDFLRSRLKLVETGNFTIRGSGEGSPAENSPPSPRDPKEGA